MFNQAQKKKEYINCKFPIFKNKFNLKLCEIHLPFNEIGHEKMILCPECNDKIGVETLKNIKININIFYGLIKI